MHTIELHTPNELNVNWFGIRVVGVDEDPCWICKLATNYIGVDVHVSSHEDDPLLFTEEVAEALISDLNRMIHTTHQGLIYTKELFVENPK